MDIVLVLFVLQTANLTDILSVKFVRDIFLKHNIIYIIYRNNMYLKIVFG